MGYRGGCFEVVVESLGKDFILSGSLSTVSPATHGERIGLRGRRDLLRPKLTESRS